MLKGNCPATWEAVRTSFADPQTPRERDIAIHRHGDREERRTLEVSSEIVPHLGWPTVQQVCRIHREVEYISGQRCGQTTSEWQYAITSQSAAQAGPAQLQALWRGHWQIENGLHWVRDVTLGEDACHIRVGHAPKNMAAVRNCVLNVLRLAHYSNIASACRSFAWHPKEALALLGISLA